MQKEIIDDIIEWDIYNWTHALKFWENNSNVSNGNLKCLELGAMKGGPSLWLSLLGNEVVCSDLNSPKETAKALHEKYGIQDKIKYEAINATNIPYSEEFDIVILKSILGGIARVNSGINKIDILNEIHKSLKPGGKVLFAENLEASGLHKFFRRKFVKWGADWNYLKHKDIENLFTSFESFEYKTIGFFGTFGRTNKQRNFLGKVDKILKPITPRSKRYIVYGVATK